MIKIMLSAGEVSGDFHASALAKELKNINKNVYMFGMGGDKMKNAGVDIKVDISSSGTVGVVEVIRHLPRILSAYFIMKRLLKNERPDILVLVDYQGFNMMLASYAKNIGIKTAYYIPPQEWLWGTEKGVKKVVNTIDRIISIFEKEAAVYKDAGGNVTYVGNPNLDTARPSLTREEFCAQSRLNPSFPIIGLFPGSRLQEIRGLLPLIIDSSSKLKRAIPNAQFVLSLSSNYFENDIKRILKSKKSDLVVYHQKNFDIMSASNVIIAASGTTILEAAILGTPAVMLYKVSPVTYFIGKNLLKIKLKFFTMPNLLAGKEVVPELVQDDATVENVFENAYNFLINASSVKKIKDNYRIVVSGLGSPGAVKRAAEAVFFELKGKI